ncbi:hypothetical protein [Cellulomonas sp. KRMCY2]|uniref:hypothetical protein n=1 Tax=Cellulomonas sp. KRMCY2 TaxID=1304865 RepID=UPI00045EB169|nr:hypothetical protein [Cellulomonas sp. KRMCY2]
MSTPTSREPDERDTSVPPLAEPSRDGPLHTGQPSPAAPPAPPLQAPSGSPAPPTQGPPPPPTQAEHVAPRPYPATPSAYVTPTSALPGTPPTAAPAQVPTAAAPAAPAAAPAGALPVVPPAVPETRRNLRADHATGAHEHGDEAVPELPEPPGKPGIARHLVGFLLGLVLTPVALLLTGIGTARMADLVGTDSPLTDALGLTLLVVGALLLAVIVLLGVWSPTVPITGGLVWGVCLGVAYLVVPAALDDTVEALSADRVVPAAVDQLTEGAMSGQLVVTGILLLTAGLATAIARRIGRRWAEGVATAEAAQADAARAEAARAEAARAEAARTAAGPTSGPGHTAP